jgi:hypothetical protein
MDILQNFSSTGSVSQVYVFTALLFCARFVIMGPFVRFVMRFEPNAFISSSSASSLISLIHGLTAIIVCGYLLFSYPTLIFSQSISDFPQEWQKLSRAMINFTTSYMWYDGTYMLFHALRFGFAAEPYLFDYYKHHVACLLYLYSVQYYNAGIYSVLGLIFLGELSNPAQSMYFMSVSGLRDTTTPWKGLWNSIRTISLPIFAVMFAGIRFLLAPPIFIYFVYHFLFSGQSNIPIWVGFCWSLIFGLVIHGSRDFARTRLEEAGLFGFKSPNKTE